MWAPDGKYLDRWAVYAGASALLVSVSAVATGLVFESRVRSGIWAGLGVAWLVQLAAFAALIAATNRNDKYVLAGWSLGTFLRLAVVGLLAWLTLAGIWPLPAEPTLVALVLALFALLLLEPVFFRHRFETQ